MHKARGGRMLSSYGDRLVNDAIKVLKTPLMSADPSFVDLEDLGFNMQEVWVYCHQYATNTQSQSYRDAYQRIHKYVFHELRRLGYIQ